MMFYHVYAENRIEARSSEEAEESLLMENSLHPEVDKYFTVNTEEDYQAALDCYYDIRLDEPRKIGDGLKWYHGKILEFVRPEWGYESVEDFKNYSRSYGADVEKAEIG